MKPAMKKAEAPKKSMKKAEGPTNAKMHGGEKGNKKDMKQGAMKKGKMKKDCGY